MKLIFLCSWLHVCLQHRKYLLVMKLCANMDSFPSRWRLNIRKALSPSAKAASATPKDESEKQDDEDDDQKVLNEMEELAYAMDRKKKRAKKVLAKRRAKVCSTSMGSVKFFLPRNPYLHFFFSSLLPHNAVVASYVFPDKAILILFSVNICCFLLCSNLIYGLVYSPV